MKQTKYETTVNSHHNTVIDSDKALNDDATSPLGILADLEATLNGVADANPRISEKRADDSADVTDLKALLEVSLAINSSLVLDDVLQIVMHKAIELMQAERGLVMLLDEDGELTIRTVHNAGKEAMSEEDSRISYSIAHEVVRTGKSVYASDALSDKRFAQQKSIVELHLRSIMCVPITVKEQIIGVFYLDNSSESKMFLKSDLYLFELYAQLVSNAVHNAAIYDSLLDLQHYNESVISKSPVGIVVIDSQSRIATINDVAFEIFEIEKDRVVRLGQDGERSNFLDLLPSSERKRWKHMIQTALTTRQDFSNSRYFHNTGHIEKVLSIKISPISQLPQNGDGVVMTVEDITEKVVMEKYVIHFEKLVAKGEMAASIAHELNNYLAIASSNAELMSLHVDQGKYDKINVNARMITENIFKIKRFVDSLMEFSRPEADFNSYSISHMVEDLLLSLRVQPRFARMHFDVDLESDMPDVEIDVGQIQQVLMNLCNNAADAIEERAKQEETEGNSYKRVISIGARYDAEPDQVVIKVTDNGTGMSEDTLSRIFNVNFTTKKTGHGLGLVNCKKIIEQHHGVLHVESTLGEGTAFRLILSRFQPKDQEG
jgi:PAS domain S-box-containing protein